MNKSKAFVKNILVALAALFLAAAAGMMLFACATEKDPPPQDRVTVTLSAAELNLVMGQEARLTATVEGSDELAVWSSSDPTVAAVSGGRVTAVADGTTAIRAAVGGAWAECAVTVSSEESIVLDRTTLKIHKGKSVRVTATVKKGMTAVDAAVIYSSSDPDVAAVDETGTVTGLKLSKTPVILTAATASGKTATCEISVVDAVSLTLSQSSVTLHPNSDNTAELTASGKRGNITINAMSVNWTVADPDMVTVTVKNGKAVLTAKKSGTTTVTASVTGSDEAAVCTVDSWYAISTPADMEYMRTDINGVFKLVNDIDFRGAIWDGVTKWAGDDVPDSEYFGGMLDGQGYTIKNINILAGWNNGIIGQTAPTSIIRNLSVVNLVNQDTSNKVGSIVSFNKGLIENCYIENELRSDSQSNWNSHGGIVACNDASGILRNCIVRVKASRSFANCGAIVGYNCGAVEDCYAICTDAMLPMYGEWMSSLGYFKNCGVYSSAQKLVESAALYRFSDRIWTVTGYDVPALYNYPEVSFAAPVTYFSQGSSYVISPSNVKGIPVEWSITGNDGNLDITHNPDRSLTVSARRKGEVTLVASIYNGSTATTKIVVTGTVLSPKTEFVYLDYNNPALADTDRIELFTDKGEAVGSGVTYTSDDTRVATVDEFGNITAVGKGECGITVDFGGDVYENLVKVIVTGWEQISTAEQFDAMRNGLSLNYCLVNDIDFGGADFAAITPWTSSENDSLYFNGVFDGNGYTVSNIAIRGNNVGIWGRTATTAVIRNTVFDGIRFYPAAGASEQVSFGVVSFNTGIIQNIVVHATAYAGHSTDYRSGGGVCGTNEFRGRVFNCISYMDASAVPGGMHVASIMALCQGVAKDCIGIVVGAGDCYLNAISFINSSSVSACKQFGSESAAAADYAPFGSFDTRVWDVSGDGLPVLKKLITAD